MYGFRYKTTVRASANYGLDIRPQFALVQLWFRYKTTVRASGNCGFRYKTTVRASANYCFRYKTTVRASANYGSDIRPQFALVQTMVQI